MKRIVVDQLFKTDQSEDWSVNKILHKILLTK